MKLMLQQGAQTFEYEILGRGGQPLTNQQALAVVDVLCRAWQGPVSGTLAQKADFVLSRLADHFVEVANRARTDELQEGVRNQLRTELG